MPSWRRIILFLLFTVVLFTLVLFDVVLYCLHSLFQVDVRGPHCAHPARLPVPPGEERRSRSPHPTPEKPLRGRWRSRGVEKRKRNRERKNEGRPYKNSKGELIPGHSIGELCNCPLKCQETLARVQNEIFEGFWNLGDFDKQNAYLFGCIEAFNVKRRYGNTTPETSRRQKSYYFKVNIDGELKRICRKSFLSVHGLQQNRGRLNNILKQVKSGCTPKTDQRGKHTLNRPNRVSEDKVQAVHDHIKSIPTYQSHYSRSQNPQRVFFDCNLNITSLYRDLYLPYCQERNIETVSEDFYRRTFSKSYNIGFLMPKSDTCKVCDELHTTLMNDMSTQEEKTEANTKKELHLRRAEAMRAKLKELAAESKENPGDVHTISIDLQQTLPTPKLSCGPAFYLRKVWTYNVGIHDCGRDLGYMFLWDESIAARGSDEIGSCLLKYVRSMNIQSKKLIIFSDNCAGQNKNYNLVALYNYMISTGMFEVIEHYYLITGHTYLPSDRDFAKIEKYQRKEPNVYSPDQWRALISKCGKNKKFIVTQMTREDIYDFSVLKSSLNTKKQKCDEGHLVKFKDAVCFKFDKEEPMTMMLKHHLNEEFRKVSLKKRGCPAMSRDLKQKYSEGNPINPKKLADVKQLLPYVPQVHHYFYNNLKASVGASAANNEPELLD